MVIDFSKKELEIYFRYIPGSIYQDAKFVKQLQSLFELYRMEYTLCGENRACIKYHSKKKYPHTLEEIEKELFEEHQIMFHCEQGQNHYCTFQVTVPKVDKKRRFWCPRKN